MPIRRLVLAVVVVLTALVGAAGARAAEIIQPGALIHSSAGNCTLNFEFQGPSGTYMGTAAHCVQIVGEVVRDGDDVAIGDVAVRGTRTLTDEDYALIKIRPGAVARVRPGVKGSGQYPIGVSSPSLFRRLDPVQQSGFGLVLNLFRLTQERRLGVLTEEKNHLYRAVGVITGGDSGGPIVDARTGLAVGLVSRVCVGICTLEGPTVQDVLDNAAAQGVPLHLVTV